jgi:hypothetical protein
MSALLPKGLGHPCLNTKIKRCDGIDLYQFNCIKNPATLYPPAASCRPCLLKTPPGAAFVRGVKDNDASFVGRLRSGAEQVIKYLLAGADAVMTTSALLRNGADYVEQLLADTMSWLAARDIDSVVQIRGLLSQSRYRSPDSFGRANYMKILGGYETPEMERRR